MRKPVKDGTRVILFTSLDVILLKQSLPCLQNVAQVGVLRPVGISDSPRSRFFIVDTTITLGMYPQPTGATGNTIYTGDVGEAPSSSAYLQFGSGPQSRAGSWGPNPTSVVPPLINSPMPTGPPPSLPPQRTGMTGLTSIPGSAAEYAGMTSVRGHDTGFTQYSVPGGPGPPAASARAASTARFTSSGSVAPPPTIPVIVPSPVSDAGMRASFTGASQRQQPSPLPQPSPQNPSAPPSVAPQQTGRSRTSALRPTRTGTSRLAITAGEADSELPPDASLFPIPPPNPEIHFTGAPTKLGSPEHEKSGEPPSASPGAGPSPKPPASSRAGSPSIPPPKIDQSRTLQYAINLPTRDLLKSQFKGKTLADAKIAESRGAALVDAQRAFYGTHRPA